MRARLWLLVPVLVLVAAFTVRGPVANAAAAAQAPGQSTADDQTELALTVYNSDLALVRDVRTIRTPTGAFDLQFVDIAATVNPATVDIRSLSEPGRLRVLEQNYEYDLLEPDKLLQKYVGRDVTLVRIRRDAGATVEDAVRAHLLSYNGAPVWRIGGEIVTGYQADLIRFPELPANLFSRPTLVWSLNNDGGPSHRVQASYLATGLRWSADYVLTVARDDRTADLDGWVTLVNGSGTAFPDARLQLVAGDLNRVATGRGRQELEQRLQRMADMPATAELTQEAFSDYHLYTLGRTTTINQNQTKQVSLLDATAFPIVKRYVVDGQPHYYRTAHSPGAPLKDVVRVVYQFRNEEKAGLGLPIPAGVVRVYQADSRGGVQFVGEDRVTHTPKDEAIDLEIGRAFDVVATHRQVDFEKVASNVFEQEFEISLRNHKTLPVTIEVNEPIGGTWRMVSASHAWTRTGAWAAQFLVPVAPDGEVTVKYRVRVTW